MKLIYSVTAHVCVVGDDRWDPDQAVEEFTDVNDIEVVDNWNVELTNQVVVDEDANHPVKMAGNRLRRWIVGVMAIAGYRESDLRIDIGNAEQVDP